jgi:predicted ABC-type ATPase
MSVPRLRMFAGPNGSGKSTIKSVLSPELLGVYLKIVSRYTRSLDLLLEAVRHTNRAYVFDNSRDGSYHLWVAEITEGTDLEMKCDPMPAWFQRAVWDKIQAPGI